MSDKIKMKIEFRQQVGAMLSFGTLRVNFYAQLNADVR